MKKALSVVLLVLCGTGLVFADFEGELGYYGGIGNTAATGLSLQLGYLSPALKAGTEEPAGLRWGIFFDGGIGWRYGNPKNRYYTFQAYSGIPGQYATREERYSDHEFDYNLGILGELYYLPFMGIAFGGGVASGALWDNNMFAPYCRAEIPFLFKGVKLSLGFDYIFWTNDDLPNGVTMIPGYRANLSVRFRGATALQFLGFG